MVSITQRCHECSAIWTEDVTCENHFHQMGFWEMENLSLLGEVHHLMVLSYHLQHPSLYSPEGLRGAMTLLVDFVERGITPAEVRQRDRAIVDSGKRRFKIKGTAASHGAYEHPVHWTMTAADVTAKGVTHYCDNVRAWARSIYEALKASGNLAAIG
ncbi:MAG: DUF5946 family protein [Chloroflexota bacterium]